MRNSGRRPKSSCPHRKKSSPCASMPTCCDGSAASADTRPVSTPSCAHTWKRRSRPSFLKKPSEGTVRYSHLLRAMDKAPGVRSIVPALANCARTGHPLLWRCQLSRSLGHPSRLRVLPVTHTTNIALCGPPSDFAFYGQPRKCGDRKCGGNVGTDRRSPGCKAHCGAGLDFQNPKETGHICSGQVTHTFRGGFLSEPS